MGQSLTDMQSFEMGRVRKTPKDGKGPYYGATAEHLEAYKEEFHRRNGEDRDPLLSETDETAVVLSGHGKSHGRYALLNNVIKPAVKYTELRASSTTRESMANPSRAWWPTQSKEEEVSIFLLFILFLNFYRAWLC